MCKIVHKYCINLARHFQLFLTNNQRPHSRKTYRLIRTSLFYTRGLGLQP